MTEDRLVHINTLMRDLVYSEYLSVLNTVEISNMAFQTAYVPLIYDLVNLFPGVPWEESYPILKKLCMEHYLFIRSEEGFINKPILEVW